MKISIASTATAVLLADLSDAQLNKHTRRLRVGDTTPSSRQLADMESMSMVGSTAHILGTGAAAVAGGITGSIGSKSGKAGNKAGSKSSKACNDVDKPTTPTFTTVYTMDNQPNNTIVIYERDEGTGALSFTGTAETGGKGFQLGPGLPSLPDPVDDPLASTGSVIVTGDGRQGCLLAANAGSDTVSAFKIGQAPGELTLVGQFDSGGNIPVSITEREGLVYVLNAGGVGSIMGYNFVPFTCQLMPIGSPIALSREVPEENSTPNRISGTPAQVSFTPENKLLVSVKQNAGGPLNFDGDTGSLNVYDVNAMDGKIVDGSLIQTNLTRNGLGTIPFSFTFDDSGNLLLVELSSNGTIFNGVASVIENIDSSTISPDTISEATTEAGATCWVQYNPATSCVYTANNVGNSISSFSLDEESRLTFISNSTGLLNAPVDMIQSMDHKFLYALSTGGTDGSGQPAIYVYEMECDCGLREVQIMQNGLETESQRNVTSGVVNGYVGLATYSSASGLV